MIYRNKKLLEACREIECQACGKYDGTVCAAHSNQQIHGKGTGIKASDAMVASLCFTCHTELDNGKIYNKQERIDLWNEAYMKTIRVMIERKILRVTG